MLGHGQVERDRNSITDRVLVEIQCSLYHFVRSSTSVCSPLPAMSTSFSTQTKKGNTGK
jgi:hypothetical protein